jgi:hypothetical protein
MRPLQARDIEALENTSIAALPLLAVDTLLAATGATGQDHPSNCDGCDCQGSSLCADASGCCDLSVAPGPSEGAVAGLLALLRASVAQEP